MRAFVAIDLADNVRAALARQQERLRAACARHGDLRWTRPEGVHITLKFLGEVSPERQPALTEALGRLSGFRGFPVEVHGFGFFPDARHPRVLWAGVKAPPALAELAGRVDSALAELGFPREDRLFQPHLTLARFRMPRPDIGLASAIDAAGAESLGSFEVNQFVLFESRLRPAGAEYLRVAVFQGAGS